MQVVERADHGGAGEGEALTAALVGAGQVAVHLVVLPRAVDDAVTHVGHVHARPGPAAPVVTRAGHLENTFLSQKYKL